MTPPPRMPQYLIILMTEREEAPLSFCRILGATPPPHDSKILYYLNNRDEGHYYLCRILAPPPPYATILNYLNDRERRAPLSFVEFGAPPPNDPPPPPDVTILNYLTDREGRGAAGIAFCRILALPPPNAPPPPPTPQYLTILMTERVALLSFVGFWRLPPSPDATILNDFNDWEKGGGAPISRKKLNIHV